MKRILTLNFISNKTFLCLDECGGSYSSKKNDSWKFLERKRVSIVSKWNSFDRGAENNPQSAFHRTALQIKKGSFEGRGCIESFSGQGKKKCLKFFKNFTVLSFVNDSWQIYFFS